MQPDERETSYAAGAELVTGAGLKVGYVPEAGDRVSAYSRLLELNLEIGTTISELEQRLGPVLREQPPISEVSPSEAPASAIESLVIDFNMKLGWLRQITGRLDL